MNASIVGKYSLYSYKEKKEWALKKSEDAHNRGDFLQEKVFKDISKAYHRAELDRMARMVSRCWKVNS